MKSSKNAKNVHIDAELCENSEYGLKTGVTDRNLELFTKTWFSDLTCQEVFSPAGTIDISKLSSKTESPLCNTPENKFVARYQLSTAPTSCLIKFLPLFQKVDVRKLTRFDLQLAICLVETYRCVTVRPVTRHMFGRNIQGVSYVRDLC